MSVPQRRAAELLRLGATQREVARVVGRSPRTIRSWLQKVEGFREIAEGAAAESPKPLPLETLRDVLGATKADGHPDWTNRRQAATALLAAGELGEEEPSATVPEGALVLYPEALDQVLGESREYPGGHQLWWYCSPDGPPLTLAEWNHGESGEDAVVQVFFLDNLEWAQRWARALRAGRLTLEDDADSSAGGPSGSDPS